MDKIKDGRHLTKSNKTRVKHIFYHFWQNRRRFMILVSTIEFFYTHHLVALSRNHFRHFRFKKPKWRSSDKQNWQQRRKSRKPIWVPHGLYGRGRRTHLYIFGNNTASLSWPSGGHFVCLITPILLYRLSTIIWKKNYVCQSQGCIYENPTWLLPKSRICFPSVDNYVIFWFESRILPINVLFNHTLCRAYPKTLLW